MKRLVLTGFLMVVLLAGNTDAAELPLIYKLSVSFDLDKNLLKGVSTIVLQEERKADIDIGSLTVLSVKMNGQAVRPEIKDGRMRIGGKGTLEIFFEGTFKKQRAEETAENIETPKSIVSREGVYLTEGWYPSTHEMALYSLNVDLPLGFSAVSEAEDVAVVSTQQGREYTFVFPHVLPGINLVAGKYAEMKRHFGGTDIYAYFLPQDSSLAKSYIEYAVKYLKACEALLTPYPYKRFSLVVSFLPEKKSMPTLMVLGRDMLRPPFADGTSFAQEILRQWFGCLVRADLSKGDWTEGLTAHLSNRLAGKQKGKGWLLRKNLMADYASYVPSGKELPLRDFVRENDLSSMATGYGKGAMLFHSLENLLGEDSFDRSLGGLIKEREFRTVSWDDLRDAFERTSGEDLEWFFDQWLDRKGLPEIEIRNGKVEVLKGVQKVSFDVIQKNEPFRIDLPVVIKTDKGEVAKILNIEKMRETFEVPVPGNPLELIVDGDYDIPRRLSEEEFPPVLSRLLGDEKKLLVVHGNERERCRDLTDSLKGKGYLLKEESDIKDEDIKGNSLLVLDFESPVLKRLFGDFGKPESGFTVTVKKNPLNPSKVIAVANVDPKEGSSPVPRELFHYGKYSYVRFNKGNVETGIAETERGIKVNLYDTVLGIQPERAITLDDIVHKILAKPVIYVGEGHTNFEDHRVELKVITGLYESGRRFAVGMEMFQKPFQQAINDYLAGAVNEKEFLKQTQYFKRWQYDYNLYREIIEYAKAKNIPIIALNLWSEIIRTVAKGGLDALTDAEKAQVPSDMDMSDEGYRQHLKEIFENHKSLGTKNFDNFYQAQILWDETMAHSADTFLRKNPGYQMVVLAGVGHIVRGAGIPKRAFRMNGKDYVTLIPSIGAPDEEAGDFILFPDHITPPETVTLGIILKKTSGAAGIEKVQPSSVAEKAGLKEDDVLVSIDDWKIEDIDDVRIALSDKKHGEKIIIKALRKKFLLGYAEVELNAVL